MVITFSLWLYLPGCPHFFGSGFPAFSSHVAIDSGDGRVPGKAEALFFIEFCAPRA